MDRRSFATLFGSGSADARLGALRSRTIIAVGLALTVAVVVAQTASQVIDFVFFNLRLRAIDSDHHASVFGAASLLAQALAAAAIALRIASSSHRRPWLILAGLVGVLLIVRTFVRPQMTMLLLPLVAVFLSLCWLTWGDSVDVRSIVWASLLLLVCSFALHVVGPQADGNAANHLRDHAWTSQLTGMLKHGAELAGWMLLATGMIAAAWSVQAGVAARSRRGGAQI